jgi:hypothetical protein
MHHNGYRKFAGWNLISWLNEPPSQLEMVYLALYISVDIPLYYFYNIGDLELNYADVTLNFGSAVTQCCICMVAGKRWTKWFVTPVQFGVCFVTVVGAVLTGGYGCKVR